MNMDNWQYFLLFIVVFTPVVTTTEPPNDCLKDESGKFLCMFAFMLGFLGGSVVKNLPVVQEPQETWVRLLGQEDPLEEGMAIPSRIFA